MSDPVVTQADGNTPISADELDALMPNLATRQELNEWERENIIRAERWCFSERVIKKLDLTVESNVRELHRRMFCETWKWAGVYRRTEKTIGVPVIQINTGVASLLGDLKYWISEKALPPEDIPVHFHHRLVFIHPFPNGNGRHSRLAADIVSVQLTGNRLSWGRTNLEKMGDIRKEYIDALQAADNGDYKSLLVFARS